MRGCTWRGKKDSPPLGSSPTNPGMEGEGGVGLARFWGFEWRTPFPMMLCFFLFNRGGGGSTRTGARGVSPWSTPWARGRLPGFNGSARYVRERRGRSRGMHKGGGAGFLRGGAGSVFFLRFKEVREWLSSAGEVYQMNGSLKTDVNCGRRSLRPEWGSVLPG